MRLSKLWQRPLLSCSVAVLSFLWCGFVGRVCGAPGEPSPGNAVAAPEAGGQASDAIVIVWTSSFMGDLCAQGTVVGDGSLVVTAYHAVFNCSAVGRHSLPSFVFVISPYSGAVCNPPVLVCNREMDLAVLQVPWKGHPAVELAANTCFDTEESAVVLSRKLDPSEDHPPVLGEMREENLPVDSVTTRLGTPIQILLRGHGQLADGWSGCPILTHDRRCLLGCFTTKVGPRGSPETLSGPTRAALHAGYADLACGPAAGLVRKLVTQAGQALQLQGHPPVFARRADALIAVQHLVNAYHRGRNAKVTPEVFTEIRAYLDLRPQSAVAQANLGAWLNRSPDRNQAEAALKRSLEMEPTFIGHMAYAEYLFDDNRLPESQEQLHNAERLDPNNGLVATFALGKCLTRKRDMNGFLRQVDEAIEHQPTNAVLLAIRANHLAAYERYEEATQTMRKAIALYPEHDNFRLGLAACEEKAGHLEGAETELREMARLETAAQDSGGSARLSLAQFLQKHRDNAKAEAASLLRQVLQAKGPESEKSKAQELLKEIEANSRNERQTPP
jgi:tetratricopeptide (TPR) repeat protein